jgi:hypothetical protein
MGLTMTSKKATAPNFVGVLEEAARHKEPKLSPLPPGTYLCVVEHCEPAKFGEDKTDCVDFILKPLEVVEVDAEQRYQAVGIVEIGKTEIRYRVFVTEFGSQYCSRDSLWKLIKFLKRDLEVSARTLSEALANAAGKRVIVKVAHKPSSDGSRTFLAVEKTAKPFQRG